MVALRLSGPLDQCVFQAGDVSTLQAAAVGHKDCAPIPEVLAGVVTLDPAPHAMRFTMVDFRDLATVKQVAVEAPFITEATLRW